MHMNTIIPPALKKGYTIGVMAPSSRFPHEDWEQAKAILEKHGYQVFIHPQCYETMHQSAGTTQQKVSALHALASDTNIKAVFFAAGGNRALHILEHVDYDLIKSNPKIYMGFSDCTALLNAITTRTGMVTWHGPTFRKFYVGHNQEDLNLRLLEGQEKSIPLTGATALQDGIATGRLIGGNLSVFRRLIGSAEMPDTSGAILFFEDCGEEWSRMDADLCFLRRAGVFKKAAAIVFGQFTDMKDTGRPFGFTFEDIIREHTDGLNIPVLINAPFGHEKDLTAFPIGAAAQLEKSTLKLI